MVNENNIIMLDLNKMNYAFTYYSDNWLNMSWTDHVVCSCNVDSCIQQVAVLDDYVSSDHKPMLIVFYQRLCASVMCSVFISCKST